VFFGAHSLDSAVYEAPRPPITYEQEGAQKLLMIYDDDEFSMEEKRAGQEKYSKIRV
jgi:hypothetical protein